MKPGPRPRADLAARNHEWLRLYEDERMTAAAIADRAGVSASLVFKALRTVGATMRPKTAPRSSRRSVAREPVEPASAQIVEARRARRAAYMREYLRARRLDPQHRASLREADARYRAEHRVARREAERRRTAPLTEQDRFARMIERIERRGEDALARLMAEAATLEDRR